MRLTPDQNTLNPASGGTFFASWRFKDNGNMKQRPPLQTKTRLYRSSASGNPLVPEFSLRPLGAYAPVGDQKSEVSKQDAAPPRPKGLVCSDSGSSSRIRTNQQKSSFASFASWRFKNNGNMKQRPPLQSTTSNTPPTPVQPWSPIRPKGLARSDFASFLENQN